MNHPPTWLSLKISHGGAGGGAGSYMSAAWCGSGAEQSTPAHPRRHLHRAKPAGSLGWTHSPFRPHPAAPPPTQRCSTHVAPSHPASHAHSPCTHAPCAPQSTAHLRLWHHSPPQLASHTHRPSVALHEPWPLHPCMQLPGVAARHSAPPSAASHSHFPARHRPRPWHGGCPRGPVAHVWCSHSLPPQPASHAHVPLTLSHAPWPLHPLAQATVSSHAGPAKCGPHAHTPGVTAPHVPRPLQFPGHARREQSAPVQPSAHTHTRFVASQEP